MRYTRSMSKKKVRVAAGAIVIILAGGLAAAFATGYLYAGVKQPQEKILKQQIVCGQDVIDKFNAVKGEDIAKATSEVSAEVTKKPNYEVDPTCVYIKLFSEIMSSKKDEAKATYQKLEALVANGHYINPNLQSIMSLQSLKSVVNTTEPRNYGQGRG